MSEIYDAVKVHHRQPELPVGWRNTLHLPPVGLLIRPDGHRILSFRNDKVG